MRKIIMMAVLVLAAVAARGQEKADILVGYETAAPTIYGGSKSLKMSLLANASEAKYFNDVTLWIDSLKSTPEGKAQYMEIIKKTCMTVEPDGSVSFDLRKGPSKDTHTYVFTHPADGALTFYSKFGEDSGFYDEPIDEITWTIVEDSTATLLGYDCILAESDYHGRHWRAWFAPDIPVPFGPWKLRGLPGLILRAEADGGFSFTATGLESTDRMITPMYLKEDYLRVDRLKALENAEHFQNNQESILNAQGQNVKIYHLNENGNRTGTARYDGLRHSLEPDYKTKK